VILETVENNQPRREHIVADSLSVAEPFKSIILIVNQRRPGAKLEVFVDCIHQGEIALKTTFKEMATHSRDLPVEVVRT
jgi:hypothetical protein